jgi:hypothetical protein
MSALFGLGPVPGERSPSNVLVPVSSERRQRIVEVGESGLQKPDGCNIEESEYEMANTPSKRRFTSWIRATLASRKRWKMKIRWMGTTSTACAIAATLLSFCGCGGHPDAGTISISKAKEAAAQRGIPEKEVAVAPTSKIKPTAPRQRPTQALPKGGR